MIYTPATFGFDSTRFPSYRDGQLDLSFRAAQSTRRFTFMQVPPGGGKSLAYMTVPRLLSLGDRPLRVLVLVGTKGLQSQIPGDFPFAHPVFGHNNYPCRAVELTGPLAEYHDPHRVTTCDVGPCRIGIECSLRRGGCDSYDDRAIAAGSEAVVANYALWLTLGRYAEPDSLGRFDLLVLDEAHTARDWLAKSCTITLLRADLKPRGIELPPPEILDDPAKWSQWAAQASATVRTSAAVAKRLKRTTPRDVIELQRLETELGILAAVKAGGPTRWLARVQGTKQGPAAVFAPVWAQEFAERYLFRGIPKVILSSATLSPLDARYLGIAEDEYDFLERGSSFAAANRPFYYLPAARVSKQMSDVEERMWVNVIDRIVEGRLDRKGIIHTRSYDYARKILARSKYARFMLAHDSTDARAKIQAFKRAEPPCVLVSPSVEEGFDFPDDEARYVIIAKVPFLDMGDDITLARMDDDKSYANLVVAQTILQQYGRGVRNESDWAETFMLDENWGRWFSAAAGKLGLWPRYFRDAWQKCGSLPPAAPPLA